MNSKTYYVTDVERLTAKFEQLGGPNVDFTKPTGDLVVHGCHIGWTIVGSAVTVAVLGKPFYVSYGQIWNALGELFAGAK